MAQIDVYINTIIRKREELIKLKESLSKEQEKIAPLEKKIRAAKDLISRSKVQATINSKNREIEQNEKRIADINKKVNEWQKKVVKKEKELVEADKRYHNEEEKISRRNSLAEKKRLKEQGMRFDQFENKLLDYSENQAMMMDKITVLFLAANPVSTNRLRLDEEVRAIQERIRLSDYRDSIQFESRWATRSSDILQAINETNPTIIHFSGHGTPDGNLVLLNTDGSPKCVNKEAITMAISTASDTVRLVLFNACFSKVQAENIVQNIEAAIGMNDSVSDETAIVFAAQLYSAIGFGHSLKKAYNQAIAGIMLEGIPEERIPRLFVRDGVASESIIYVSPDIN